jgi:hypothetical protein
MPLAKGILSIDAFLKMRREGPEVVTVVLRGTIRRNLVCADVAVARCLTSRRGLSKCPGADR